MRIVYLDCSSGIAGDMLLAALVDLGAPEASIIDGLNRLHLTEPWTLSFERAVRRGISALRAQVTVAGVRPDVHWEDGPAGAGSQPKSVHVHDHAHAHEHGDHAHPPHRPYRGIRRLLAEADLPSRVVERSQRVFAELALAEGAVHGKDPDDVHFHEVGSTDAIIDIVGACLALEALDVDALEASPLHVGKGFVRAAHGRMPIPAPATLRLVEGMDIYQTDVEGELVTPTGAALVRALCRRVGPMEPMRVVKTGWGAGAKELPIPNVLRAVLGEPLRSGSQPGDTVVELVANIDDMNPQLFGALFDSVLEAGAKDVWVQPAVMKKGRPGHILHALVSPDREASITELILRETTTLGVRSLRLRRQKLERDWIEVGTAGGTVRVKVARRGGEVWNVAAEYDDCVAAAKRCGRPVKDMVAEAVSAALTALQQQQAGSGGPT